MVSTDSTVLLSFASGSVSLASTSMATAGPFLLHGRLRRRPPSARHSAPTMVTVTVAVEVTPAPSCIV